MRGVETHCNPRDRVVAVVLYHTADRGLGGIAGDFGGRGERRRKAAVAGKVGFYDVVVLSGFGT